MTLEGYRKPLTLSLKNDNPPENFMSKIAGLRSRVERLLNGTFRADDFAFLFLTLREHSFGREIVREIGDFVAHSSDRTKGIVTQAVKDFFAVATMNAANGFAQIVLPNVSQGFSEALRANLRIIDHVQITADTGLKQNTQKKCLDQLLKKFQLNPNGTESLIAALQPEEVSLINALLSRLNVKCAFSEDKLFSQFTEVLIKNRLLKNEELVAFVAIKMKVSLFVISQMHLCTITFDDGSKALLSASSDCGNGTIGVNAKKEILNVNPTGNVFISFPIYVASRPAKECCDANLYNETGIQHWSQAIELSENGILINSKS